MSMLSANTSSSSLADSEGNAGGKDVKMMSAHDVFKSIVNPALTRLVDNDAERIQIGERAREAVLSKHRAETISRQWIDLLTEVACGEAASSVLARKPMTQPVDPQLVEGVR